MVPLSAHLGFQFTEFPLRERFAVSASVGYRGVELPAPYQIEIDELAGLLEKNSLELVQIATPMGNPVRKEKGLAALRGREGEFRKGVEKSIQYARALGCHRVHPMAGISQSPGSEGSWETYVGNITYAVNRLAEEGITTIVEVISESETPGYYMSSFDKAEALFAAVKHPQLTLLFDIYHAQDLTGDWAGTLQRWKGRVGHVQIADHPGRHEPGTGALDFCTLFDELNDQDYTGWAGCEYRPRTTTLEGLALLKKYLFDVR